MNLENHVARSFPGYEIRNVSRSRVTIGAKDTSQTRILKVGELLDYMGILSSSEELYPKFLETTTEVFESKGKLSPQYYWTHLADAILKDALRFFPEEDRDEIYDEVSGSIDTVMNQLFRAEELPHPRQFVNYHGQIAENNSDTPYQVYGVCPFPRIARDWVKTYLDVSKKAQEEHPEFF